jgi:Membrane bound O-acyl transferase family
MELLTLGENIKGWSAKVPFRNPLFLSTSPTDFWGRRWNTVIHDVLKGGAFKPARKYFPAPVALACCFLLSGLIHDFAFSCSFYQPRSARDPETGVCEYCYSVPIYKLTLFFLWNGMMMILEKPLAKLPLFAWMSKNLPTPVISTLVLFTALPVSHWFTGDWVLGGNYEAIIQVLWIVKRLD